MNYMLVTIVGWMFLISAWLMPDRLHAVALSGVAAGLFAANIIHRLMESKR